jgi:exodeoxyribonuclease VII small subunit
MRSVTLIGMSVRGGESQDLGFDGVLGRLREVVERLESGNLSLEDSLSVYEEGVRLARRGHDLLDGAEKRVELLVSAAGGTSTVPFDAEEPGAP